LGNIIIVIIIVVVVVHSMNQSLPVLVVVDFSVDEITIVVTFYICSENRTVTVSHISYFWN